MTTVDEAGIRDERATRRGLSGRPLLDTALDARWFTGQASPVRTILGAVSDELNTLVLGGRGTGKTSLLRHVEYLLRSEPQSGLTVSYCDAAPYTQPAELLTVLRELLTGPREVMVGTPGASLYPLFGQRSDEWSQPGLLLREIDMLRRRLLGDENRHVVLFDAPHTPTAHTLFGRHRDELWSLPITWVVTGDTDKRGTLLEPPADAFFEQRVELAPLDEATARELVRRRVGEAILPDSLLDAVIRATEGNPRELINAAREASAAGPGWEEARTDACRLFDEALAPLGRAAAMLVAEMRARNAAISASDAQLQARLGWTRPRLTQVLQSLAKAGLVIESYESSGGPGRPRKLYQLAKTPMPTS